MAGYFGYVLLGAGILVLLIAWIGKPRRSLTLIFAAAVMIMGGLAILQFLGTEAPSL